MHAVMKVRRQSALIARTIMAVSAATVLFSTEASAHVGPHSGSGFSAGFGHPLSGIDHLLAMVAVGILAGFLGRQSRWALPGAFLIAMVAGAGLGKAGLGATYAETGIIASLIVLGLLLSTRIKLPIVMAVSIIIGFAFFHGLAHGHEMPTAIRAIDYGLGFVLATAILHVAGVALGEHFARYETPTSVMLQRACGGLIAAVGLGTVLGGL